MDITRAQARRDREKGLWHYIGLALSGALLLLVIAMALLVIVIPKVAGGIPLTVLTSSMIPHYPPGTLLVDRPVDPKDLRVGDVATYQIESGRPGVITHRIVAIHSSSDGSRTFQFKGDNNSQPDVDNVIEKQIQGTVWYSLPFIGYVNNAVNGESRNWIVPVLAGLLFVYAGFTVASAIVGSRRKRRAKPGTIDER
ncbi:signal peptidase I [Glaciihabitans sp. UYNi722]|uniref:signal peptidase I n=1 Tax=Glaciihabitans sp. UYNi722 TaxID=3156344 RepID=UPI0033960AD6